MRSRRITRSIVLGLTVLAVCSSLVAVLLALVAEGGGLQEDGVTAAWLMPVVAVLVVAGVSWLLLGETPRRDMPASGAGSSETCPQCGREVGAGWRLCPWCGSRSADARKPLSGNAAGPEES